jgi:ethanolamine permease
MAVKLPIDLADHEAHKHHVGVVTHHELKQSLTTLQLWAIAVGLVISGEYFGWSYGWATAGTLGFTITALFIAAMYTTFIFSFTELTTSIPHAGGPFAYARHAFGPTGGYFAGAATLIEFVFAPPAIALAIGAYFLTTVNRREAAPIDALIESTEELKEEGV